MVITLLHQPYTSCSPDYYDVTARKVKRTKPTHSFSEKSSEVRVILNNIKMNGVHKKEFSMEKRMHLLVECASTTPGRIQRLNLKAKILTTALQSGVSQRDRDVLS